MGILDYQRTPQDDVKVIKQMNQTIYQQRVMFVKDSFNKVWNNSRFTPAQMIEAMGAEATEMFQAHSEEQDFLTAIATKSGLIYTRLTPTQNITFNQDGSVTITGA